MNDQRGFTLVEVVVVALMISTIVAMATLYFSQLNQKYRVDSTTKDIYTLLLRARNDSSTSNTRHIALLSANRVQTGADTNADNIIDGTINTIQTALFTISFTASPIIFDRRGLTTNLQTIRITGYPANITPAMDCIVIAATRINIGRMEGVNCVQQ